MGDCPATWMRSPPAKYLLLLAGAGTMGGAVDVSPKPLLKRSSTSVWGCTGVELVGDVPTALGGAVGGDGTLAFSSVLADMDFLCSFMAWATSSCFLDDFACS